MSRVVRMTPTDVRQRAGTAMESLQVALERQTMLGPDTTTPRPEAQVAATNAIQAAIAACDAICGRFLGERSSGGDHRDAVDLVESVEPGGVAVGRRMRRLLSQKSQLQCGGYCTGAVSARAVADAEAVVKAMGDYGIRP